MIKLSDYVINFLVEKDVSDIFLVSGGGIMHLLDSVGRNKKLKYISNHHEQASAICAESYARLTNHIAACLVTTGPGGTNAITGVAGCWVDSVPVVFISGQVRRPLIADYSRLRQLGPQEINIISIVKPLTKFAKTVMNPGDIKYELEKAFFLATSGRPGPVWLDIPLDVQASMIDENKLPSFSLPSEKSDKNYLNNKVKRTIQMLKSAKRPVLILGNGVRLAGAQSLIDGFLKRLNIPVLLPYNGLDLLPEKHPLLAGKFGPVGQRRGNFTLQNSDLTIAIGANLNISSVGFSGFAPKGKKILVNIDEGELDKPYLKLDLAICADAKNFIKEMLVQIEMIKPSSYPKWLNIIRYWKKTYPSIIPEFFQDKKHVNSYVFFDKLSDFLTTSDIIISGNSLDAASLYQAFKVKKKQRAYTNANFGAMGWCLPAAIGACVANNRKRVILVTGDGSFQLNIQELETVKYYHLPVKIFVFNNLGYESIRTSQKTHFKGFFVGADETSGVSNPDFSKLAQAHNLRYEKIENNSQLERKIQKVLLGTDAVICEINLSPVQGRNPRVASFKRADGTIESRSLEDMYPFLPRKEIYKNMHMFDEEK